MASESFLHINYGSTLEIILFIVGCEWYPLELCSACVAASKGWEYVYKLPP